MNKDIIIFGTSPYINEISDLIPRLQKKYINVGINCFPVFYPEVNHWFFYDDDMIKIIGDSRYKGQKLWARKGLKGHLQLLQIENYEIFQPVDNQFFLEDNGKLLFNNFTITIVLNWCYVKGFKNVYLAGVDMDSENWFHFYDLNNAHFVHHKRLNEVMKWIYDIQEYLNIYQLNPGNTTKLPKREVKTLI